MGDKSFFPDLICADCWTKIGGVTAHPDIIALEGVTADCAICKRHTLLIRCQDLVKECPCCKKLVPLTEWSFTPGKKLIRQKCEKCRKDEKYLKSPIDRRQF